MVLLGWTGEAIGDHLTLVAFDHDRRVQCFFDPAGGQTRFSHWMATTALIHRYTAHVVDVAHSVSVTLQAVLDPEFDARGITPQRGCCTAASVLAAVVLWRCGARTPEAFHWAVHALVVGGVPLPSLWCCSGRGRGTPLECLLRRRSAESTVAGRNRLVRRVYAWQSQVVAAAQNGDVNALRWLYGIRVTNQGGAPVRSCGVLLVAGGASVTCPQRPPAGWAICPAHQSELLA